MAVPGAVEQLVFLLFKQSWWQITDPTFKSMEKRGGRAGCAPRGGMSLPLTPGAARRVFPSDLSLSWEQVVFWG